MATFTDRFINQLETQLPHFEAVFSHTFTSSFEERLANRVQANWHPLPERDASKLLIFRNGHISEDRYSHIAAHLPANSLLVFNNSRVIRARLRFKKPTGGRV